MAQVISSLLVGIGFDYDKQSAQQVDSGIDGIKSKALGLASVVAGAFGANALTFGFASAADELGKFSETFGLLSSDVSALGGVFEKQGGTLQGFLGQLETLERFRAQLKIGDAGFLAEAGRAGLDVGGLVQAENALEGLLNLADQFAAADIQQRLNMADAIGLDAAAIRLLSMGRKEIEGSVENQRSLLDLSSEMTRNAVEFNDAWHDSQRAVSGLAAIVSNDLLPPITDALGELTEFIQLTKEVGAGEAITQSAFGEVRSDLFQRAATGEGLGAFTEQIAKEQQEGGLTVATAFAAGAGDLLKSVFDVIGFYESAFEAAGLSSAAAPSAGRGGNVTVDINSPVMLDGQKVGSLVDSRIIRHEEIANQETIQNLESSVD